MATSSVVSIDQEVNLVNSTSTINSNDSCRQYVVGYHDDDLSDCENATDIRTLIAGCNSVTVQDGYFWMQLIASFLQRPSDCAESLFRYKIYNDENNNNNSNSNINGTDNNQTLEDDLSNGLIDLYPIRMALDENSSRVYYSAMSQAPLKYFFYMNAKHVRMSATGMYQTSFLTSPFEPSAWWGTVLVIAVVLLVRQSVFRFRLSFGAKFVDDLLHEGFLLLPLAAVGLAYSTLLKAMVIVGSPTPPFRSMIELIDRMQRRELQILLEDGHSRRYKLLTREELATTEPSRQLVRLIQSWPDALQVRRGMKEVCNDMQIHTNKVFLGYDDLTLNSCTEMCFWKFRASDFRNVYASFNLKKQSSFHDMANLATYALLNYNDVQLDMKSKKNCEIDQKSVGPISLFSLFYAFVLIVVSWASALVIFAVEIVFHRFQQKRIFELYDIHLTPRY